MSFNNLTASEKSRFLTNGPFMVAARLATVYHLHWDWTTVGESAERVGTGSTPPSQDSRFYGGSINWFAPSDIGGRRWLSKSSRTITEDATVEKKAPCFEANTLLITCIGDIGRLGLLKQSGSSNQQINAVKFKEHIDPEFAYFSLFARRDELLEAAPTATTLPILNQNRLKTIKFPYPPYREQKQIARFLAWYEDRFISGTTGSFKDCPPLPDYLADLPRIVGRIEELAGKVEEARRLRAAAAGETAQLVTSLSRTIFDNTNWPEVPLFELLTQDTRNGIGRKPSDEPIGVPILRISAGTSRSDAIVDETDHKYIEVTERELEAYTLEKDDLLACRFNGNLRFVGRFSLYKGFSNQVQVYPDKLIRFRVDKSKVMPEYVRIAANSPKVRGVIEGFCATTAGNLGISASNLKTVTIPVPPLNTQKQIVELVDQMHTKVNTLTKLQTSTQHEIDALLPSILDKAFKGEL